MVKKKAFMKTLESLMVIVFSILFTVVILPKQAPIGDIKQNVYLVSMEDNPVFRDFVQTNDLCINRSSGSTVNEVIDQYVEQDFGYVLCSGVLPTELPKVDMSIDSMYYAGNVSDLDFKTVRLYYWVTG